MSRDLYIRYNNGGIWKNIYDTPYHLDSNSFGQRLKERKLSK